MSLLLERFKLLLNKFTKSQLPIILFLICAFVFLAIATVEKPRILILHSYATDFAWVKDINIGINRVLEGKPYQIQYYYMDTKRHPELEFKTRAGKIARRIISEWEPNVIIAVDDDAQLFAAKYFINNPKIQIVFTGVNAEPKLYGYDGANNVTGILERIPFNSIKEAFIDILPKNKRRIVHYSDSSNTSEAIHQEMDDFDWNPIQLIEHRQIETFEEWKQVISKADRQADFLLITHYHTIKRSATDKTVVPPAEVMKWTVEHSPIPDIGCWGFYVKDGGMFALGVSPYEQGERAAKMTVDLIKDRQKAGSILIETSNLYVAYLRESRIKKYGVELPDIYNSFAHATNNYYN
jgi:ABC-type uncharacterized transport system substrate-binding protein